MAPEIRLVTGHPQEEQARDQLLRLLSRYDVSRWQFTNVVQIQHMGIPHSHPVLTLNTISLGDDDQALSTYLHEQIHWYVLNFELEHRDQARRLEEELRGRYPVVPRPDDQNSPYLHLIICTLEFASLSELIGPEESEATLSRKSHYRWIYDTTLADRDYFAGLLARYGLQVPV